MFGLKKTEEVKSNNNPTTNPNALNSLVKGTVLEGTITSENDIRIDGIIKADRLGFDRIYIQAKKWNPDRTIGRPEIQKFLGALVGQGANKGLFITTCGFSKEASDFVEKSISQRISLVDGKQLTTLMIEHNIGVSTQSVYTIKSVDSDYFNYGF